MTQYQGNNLCKTRLHFGKSTYPAYPKLTPLTLCKEETWQENIMRANIEET